MVVACYYFSTIVGILIQELYIIVMQVYLKCTVIAINVCIPIYTLYVFLYSEEMYSCMGNGFVSIIQICFNLILGMGGTGIWGGSNTVQERLEHYSRIR
jgi:hypothetical protein